MNRRQIRMAARKPRKATNWLPILVIASFVVVLGLIGHQEQKSEQLMMAGDNCRFQTTHTIPTHDQCIANQLEANNDK